MTLERTPAERVVDLENRIDAVTIKNAESRRAWTARVEDADEDDADELFEAAELLAWLRRELRVLRGELAGIADEVAAASHRSTPE